MWSCGGATTECEGGGGAFKGEDVSVVVELVVLGVVLQEDDGEQDIFLRCCCSW